MIATNQYTTTCDSSHEKPQIRIEIEPSPLPPDFPARLATIYARALELAGRQDDTAIREALRQAGYHVAPGLLAGGYQAQRLIVRRENGAEAGRP